MTTTCSYYSINISLRDHCAIVTAVKKALKAKLTLSIMAKHSCCNSSSSKRTSAYPSSSSPQRRIERSALPISRVCRRSGKRPLPITKSQEPTIMPRTSEDASSLDNNNHNNRITICQEEPCRSRYPCTKISAADEEVPIIITCCAQLDVTRRRRNASTAISSTYRYDDNNDNRRDQRRRRTSNGFSRTTTSSTASRSIGTRKLWWILVLWCLSSSTLFLPGVHSQDYKATNAMQCKLFLAVADANRDTLLDATTEYQSWLNRVTQTQAYTGLALGDLPASLQELYTAHAMSSGGQIDIAGARPGSTTLAPQQGMNLDAMCNAAATAFANAVTATAAPGGTTTPVGTPLPATTATPATTTPIGTVLPATTPPDATVTPGTTTPATTSPDTGNTVNQQAQSTTNPRICSISLAVADRDRNNVLTPTEFVAFVNRITQNAYGTDFAALPQALQDTYTTLSATSTSVDGLPIDGASPAVTATPEQQAVLDQICLQTDTAIFNSAKDSGTDNPVATTTSPVGTVTPSTMDPGTTLPGSIPPEGTTTLPGSTTPPATTTVPTTTTTPPVGTNDPDIPRTDLNICKISMFAADANKDDLLDSTEYVTYINRISRNQYWAGITTLDAMPQVLQDHFNSVAEGGQLDVFGASPAQPASEAQEETLADLCQSTDTAIFVANGGILSGPTAPTDTPVLNTTTTPPTISVSNAAGATTTPGTSIPSSETVAPTALNATLAPSNSTVGTGSPSLTIPPQEGITTEIPTDPPESIMQPTLQPSMPPTMPPTIPPIDPSSPIVTIHSSFRLVVSAGVTAVQFNDASNPDRVALENAFGRFVEVILPLLLAGNVNLPSTFPPLVSTTTNATAIPTIAPTTPESLSNNSTTMTPEADSISNGTSTATPTPLPSANMSTQDFGTNTSVPGLETPSPAIAGNVSNPQVVPAGSTASPTNATAQSIPPVAATTAPVTPGAVTSLPTLPASTTSPAVPGAATTLPTAPLVATAAPAIPGAADTLPSAPVASTVAPGLPLETSVPGLPTTSPQAPIRYLRSTRKLQIENATQPIATTPPDINGTMTGIEVPTNASTNPTTFAESSSSPGLPGTLTPAPTNTGTSFVTEAPLLGVSLGGAPQLLRFEEGECEASRANASCIVAFASYDVNVTGDVDRQSVYNILVARTQDAIQSGQLQIALDQLNPNALFSIDGASFPPYLATDAPTQPLTTSGSEETSEDNKIMGLSMGAFIGIVVALVVMVCLAFALFGYVFYNFKSTGASKETKDASNEPDDFEDEHETSAFQSHMITPVAAVSGGFQVESGIFNTEGDDSSGSEEITPASAAKAEFGYEIGGPGNFTVDLEEDSSEQTSNESENSKQETSGFQNKSNFDSKGFNSAEQEQNGFFASDEDAFFGGDSGGWNQQDNSPASNQDNGVGFLQETSSSSSSSGFEQDDVYEEEEGEDEQDSYFDEEESDSEEDSQAAMYREEIVELVRVAAPHELDNVDTMMEQFKGREDELLQTLKTMHANKLNEDSEVRTFVNKLLNFVFVPSYLFLIPLHK